MGDDQKVRANEEVELLQNPVAVVVAARSDPVEHQEVLVPVDVDFGTLVPGPDVLDGQGMELELPLERFELLLVGSLQIGVEKAAFGRQMGRAALERKLFTAAVGVKKDRPGSLALGRFDAFGPANLSGIE